MASEAGRVGWGRELWKARLTPKLDILRLTTLGLARSRRSGSNSQRISCKARERAAERSSGGKDRVCDLHPPDRPQGAHERYSVGVFSRLQGRIVHQGANRVMSQEISIDLLLNPFR